MRPSTIFALVMGVIWWTTATAWAGDTSCASLDIHIKGDAVKGGQSCKDGQFGNTDDGIALTESIEVNGDGFVLYVDHLKAGTRTYLTRQSFDDALEDGTSFDRIDNLMVYPVSRGYSARKFVGFMAQANASYPCFAFLRYSGTSFSGARHMVFGLYCEFAGDEVDDVRVDEVMAAIDTDF